MRTPESGQPAESVQPQLGRSETHGHGILSARPAAPSEPPLAPEEHQLDLRSRGVRPGCLLYVPASRREDRPAPLLLLLHGAGSKGSAMLPAFRAQAERTGTLLLAPNAQGVTWDVIQSEYGRDVHHLDAALETAFSHFAVAPEHLAVGGFSDGASYALSIGIINGALFSHVLAFAPGFLAPTRMEDSPRLFIAHGIDDQVLPIDHCSRRMVPRLKETGFELEYHEFAGGHVVSDEVVDEAFAWFLGS